MLKIKNVDMTKGPIIGSILAYAFPLILSTVLQILFNAADLAIVGKFAGDDAIAATAAVGATGAFIHLIVNTVMGLSGGVNIVLARSLGAKDTEKSSMIIHTAITTSLFCGIVVGIIGVFVSPFAMEVTKCPIESFDKAIKYLTIYFIGAPAIFIYNFSASILRCKGDTKRPLTFLVIAGVVNVLLNLFFVIICKMDADGVALATAISQYFAAFLTVRCLVRRNDDIRLDFKHLKVRKIELLEIVKYGLPGGFTNAIYSLANIQIQSAINTFGTSAVSGSSAVGSLEGFIMATASSMNSTALTFIGQNIGAGEKKRIKKIMLSCTVITVIFALVLGYGMYFLGETLYGLYLPKNAAAAFEAAAIKAEIFFTLYFLLSFAHIFGAMSQAFGYSLYTTIVSIIGIFGLRTVWMNTVYINHKTIQSVYWCYPVSWALMLVLNGAVLFVANYKYMKKGYIK